jgi:hypothetical protein
VKTGEANDCTADSSGYSSGLADEAVELSLLGILGEDSDLVESLGNVETCDVSAVLMGRDDGESSVLSVPRELRGSVATSASVSVSGSGATTCNNVARGGKDEDGEDKEDGDRDGEELIPAKLCNEGESRDVAEVRERLELI